MTGSEICATIINIVKEYINSEDFRVKYRIDNCFTRVRKLTMGIVMMFLLSNRKKSLPNEIDDFLSAFGSAITNLIGKPVPSFTKQAISKARKGIKLDAFYWLLDVTVSTFFECKPSYSLWHGLHLFAIDGTDVQLPMVERCSKLFGSQKLQNNSDFPFAKGSYLYSVSTHLVADVLLERCKYTIDLFKELYFQRWPIETKYKQVKSRFQMENFSGYSEEAIDQANVKMKFDTQQKGGAGAGGLRAIPTKWPSYHAY